MKKDYRRCSYKAVACIAAAALMCTSALPGTFVLSGAAAGVSGDLNGDSSVTSADVSVLQKALLGTSTLTADQYQNADVTGDGAVDGLDLTRLRQMVTEQNPVSDVIYIHLSDSGITVEGDTEGVTSISSDGKTVTITSSGSYYVDGSITDGQIYINTAETDTESVDLFMTDVSMTTSTGAPCIYAAAADKVKITLYGTNTLTDTSTTAATDTNGVIDAECDLTITKNSTGSLEVTSSVNTGIYAKDDLKLNGGYITVNTDVDDASDADAIKCKNTLEVDGATVTIDSSADGLKSTKEDVVITSGTVTIKAGNDAVQAATDLTISGGTVIACGDRGFRLDEGGTLNITGGSVLATGTDYGVNVDSTETYDVSGSTQTIMQFAYTEEQTKNTSIVLQENGTTVYSGTPIKKYDYVLISDSSLSSSASYTQYTNGTQMTHSAATTAGVFANSGTFTTYTEVQAMSGGGTITTDDDVATALVYASSSVTAYNASGAEISDPSNVTISGTTATVTLESEIDVSGSCSNGQLVVNVDKDTYSEALVVLNLEGLTLTNSSSAAILVEAIGDEVQLVAKNGYTNTISDGSSYTATDSTGDTISAAIYSRDDMKIKGKGELIVNGNYADGIVCKNDLKLWNGTLTVNAVDDGIRGNDSVRIGDPDDTDYSALSVNVTTTQGDGIKTKSTDDDEGYVTINGGTVTINAGSAGSGDGIQAKQNVYMYGGTVDIYTYSGYSYSGSGSSSSGGMGGGMSEGNSNATENSCKGIKAVGRFEDEDSETTYKDQGNIWIYDGDITINSSDDCIHTGGNVYLYGGTYDLRTADDGIHSDNDLYIGETAANSYDSPYIEIGYSYEGVEGFDIVVNCGSVLVYATDDGFNAAGGNDSSGTSGGGGFDQGNMGSGGSNGSQCLTINGGYTYVNASGDGLDSNGDMYLNGGYVCVIQNGSGNEPLDYGDSNQCYYNGGTVLAVGNGESMGEMPSNALFDSTSLSISANSTITFTDSSNNVLATVTVPYNVGMMTFCCDSTDSASCYTGATLSNVSYFAGITNCTADSGTRFGYGGTASTTNATLIESEGNVGGGTSGNEGPNSGSNSGGPGSSGGGNW